VLKHACADQASIRLRQKRQSYQYASGESTVHVYEGDVVTEDVDEMIFAED
jgi:hypothetical protein